MEQVIDRREQLIASNWFEQVLVELHIDDLKVGFDRSHHRNLTVQVLLANPFEYLITGQPGHPSVQQDDVDIIVETIQCFRAAVRDSDSVGVAQLLGVDACHPWIVVDDQHTAVSFSHPLIDASSVVVIVSGEYVLIQPLRTQARRPDTKRPHNIYVVSTILTNVDRVEVSTVVYLPPEEIYEFLEDFPRYANYSEYLQEVRTHGEGQEGTRYALRFAWWKLNYTAHSEVTDTDPPTRIDWEVIKDIHAHGFWRIDPLDESERAERDHACRVHFVVEFDTDTARSGALDVPRFVSVSWVIDKVKPLILEEAERIVERIVRDIEGEPRPVELTIHDRPSSV